jgi:hypothetical protein
MTVTGYRGLRFITPVGRDSSLSATPARGRRPPNYGGPIGLYYILPLPKRLLNVDGNGGLCLVLMYIVPRMTQDTAVAFQHTISQRRCALYHRRLHLARRGFSAHQYYILRFATPPTTFECRW